MDAKRFRGKHGIQRHFNKQQSHHSHVPRHDQDVRPHTIVMKFDQPEQARGVEATYTTDPVEAEAWLRNNVIDVNETALGFDMEWKPQFVKKKLGGKENRTAVLQLSTETSCLVLHIIHIKAFPRYLVDIIGNQNIAKVGCGIRQDINKLFRDTGLRCKGAVELVQLASKIGCTKEQGLGLKALSKNLLGIEIEKPKRIQMSNWESLPLHRCQIHYAALDAWMGIELYLHMKGELVDGGQIVCEPEPAKSLPLVSEPEPAKSLSLQSSYTTVYCHVCGKKCIGQSGLQEHLANTPHTACPQCGRMFVREVSKKHLRKCSVALVVAQLPQI